LSLPRRCASCQAQKECLFFTIPLDLLHRIQSAVEIRCYSRGYTVFRQGQAAIGVYIVRTGWLKLYRLTDAGRRTVVGIASPGTVLGLVAVVTRAPFSQNAETLEECELEFVSERDFLSILEQNPLMALNLLRAVGERTRKSHDDLYNFAGRRPSAERLFNVLQKLGQACGQRTADGIRLRLPFTVQDLADEIACSRQWTTRLLTELEARHLIQRKNGWIVLMQPVGEPTPIAAGTKSSRG